MFSFEGAFKRRLKVSLRGGSRNEKKASLLHRTQERQKQEEERRRLKNAVKIQSLVRGYRNRRHEYSIQKVIAVLIWLNLEEPFLPLLELI